MGVVAYHAVFISHSQFRVMVFAMTDPGQRVHEGHGFVVVLEGEGAHQRVIIDAQPGTSGSRPSMSAALSASWAWMQLACNRSARLVSVVVIAAQDSNDVCARWLADAY